MREHLNTTNNFLLAIERKSQHAKVSRPKPKSTIFLVLSIVFGGIHSNFSTNNNRAGPLFSMNTKKRLRSNSIIRNSAISACVVLKP